MLSKKASPTPQLGFYSTFEEQLSHHHPLYILANKIEWTVFDDAFKKHYSEEGRPANPIRLMVALLMLKHLRNLSDESVVEQWMENVYYQYFSEETAYACKVSQIEALSIKDSPLAKIVMEAIENGPDWIPAPLTA